MLARRTGESPLHATPEPYLDVRASRITRSLALNESLSVEAPETFEVCAFASVLRKVEMD